MRKYLLISICFMLVMPLVGCKTKSLKVDGFSSPESVTSDGKYFYVSNVGEELKPMDKDGDGYISRLSADGEVLNRKFISGLNAPKGMAVVDGILYVADIDRIKGFTLADGRQVLNLDFSTEGTSFLNDIAVFEGGKLLVSAMDVGALYIVETGLNPSFKKVECDFDLSGPNGVCYDRETGTVYVASFGKDHKPTGVIGRGQIKDGKFHYEQIYSEGGYYDGIAFVDGNVFFSDWVAFKKEGKLIQKDVRSGAIEVVKMDEKIAGPADFYFDEDGKRLWIPMMMENKILVLSCGQ